MINDTKNPIQLKAEDVMVINPKATIRFLVQLNRHPSAPKDSEKFARRFSRMSTTLSNVYLTDYIPTIYTTPRTMIYKQNGIAKKWDIFAERNGVVIIIYNVTRDRMILVKQFRPVVYLSQIPKEERQGLIDTEKYPMNLGITLEFCAGLEDKNIPTDQIAKEEVLEECGYDVPESKLEKINTIRNLSDTTGARSTYYYCEVSDDMRVSQGGGVDDEFIEVIEMSVKEVIEYIKQDYVQSPANFLYGIYWFLYNKYEKKRLVKD